MLERISEEFMVEKVESRFSWTCSGNAKLFQKMDFFAFGKIESCLNLQST